MRIDIGSNCDDLTRALENRDRGSGIIHVGQLDSRRDPTMRAVYGRQNAAPKIGAAFWCLPGVRGVCDRRIIYYAHRRRYPEAV
jgi:hypothetical protein